jgi:hypothetical protein
MQYAGEKRDQEALNRVNSYGLGTVDVGLRTQPRTQKGTNHKKRLYVWKLNTPGRSPRSKTSLFFHWSGKVSKGQTVRFHLNNITSHILT